VRDVAQRAGGPAPDRVYVFHEANAFASLRRPRMLAKRESIVGMGLPLLALLTESEMRAVLAHEVGHHIGGDVKLGPWVHRTRRAVARAVDRLEGSSFWLHLPFVAYAELFLRQSLRISRAQELSADTVAARVAGPSAAVSALRKTEVLGAAWTTYFDCEVIPVLGHGRLPPLLEGFELYWRAAQMPDTPAFESLSSAVEIAQARDAHDTHPSLAERVAALGDPPPLSDYAPPALGLLDDVARVEEKVLRELLKDENAKLTPVPWEAVADEVWLPVWRAAVAEARVLASFSLADLPRAVSGWEAIAQSTRRGPLLSSPKAEHRRVMTLLSSWLAVRLAEEGFRVTAPPGVQVRAVRDGREVSPFAVPAQLARGTLSDDAWRGFCAGESLPR
jgi:Zn-dependent protease with chaperone function